MIHQDHLLDRKQLQALPGISRSTTYRLAERGILTPVKIGPGIIR